MQEKCLLPFSKLKTPMNHVLPIGNAGKEWIFSVFAKVEECVNICFLRVRKNWDGEPEGH